MQILSLCFVVVVLSVGAESNSLGRQQSDDPRDLLSTASCHYLRDTGDLLRCGTLQKMCAATFAEVPENPMDMFRELDCQYLFENHHSSHCMSSPLKQCTAKIVSKCAVGPLGMENRVIPDSRISASSFAGDNYPPSNVKTDSDYHWKVAASDNKIGQWLQVDLGNITNITGVATRGIFDHNEEDQWVMTYSLQYSNDGETFVDYEEGRTFEGDRLLMPYKKYELNPPIISRYIRLLPKTWDRWIAMKMKLFKNTDPNYDILNDIPDSSITASSYYRFEYRPEQVRLNNQFIQHIQPGVWFAKGNIGQWIQVDLGKVTYVTGIAIQGGGAEHANDIIESYSIKYSNDGREFNDYLDSNSFEANVDKDRISKTDLPIAIYARFIRVYPIVVYRWHDIALRMELYGCLK